MVLLSYLFSALACAAVGTVSARQIDRKHIQALQREAANRLAVSSADGGGDGHGDGGVRLGAGMKNFTFSNPAASGESVFIYIRISSPWGDGRLGWCADLRGD